MLKHYLRSLRFKQRNINKGNQNSLVRKFWHIGNRYDVLHACYQVKCPEAKDRYYPTSTHGYQNSHVTFRTVANKLEDITK